MLFAAQSMFFQSAAGLVMAPAAARAPARAANPAMAVGLVYSTTTGNTETVAGYIAEETGLSAVDIADLTGEGVAAFDGQSASQTLLALSARLACAGLLSCRHPALSSQRLSCSCTRV